MVALHETAPLCHSCVSFLALYSNLNLKLKSKDGTIRDIKACLSKRDNKTDSTLWPLILLTPFLVMWSSCGKLQEGISGFMVQTFRTQFQVLQLQFSVSHLTTGFFRIYSWLKYAFRAITDYVYLTGVAP